MMRPSGQCGSSVAGLDVFKGVSKMGARSLASLPLPMADDSVSISMELHSYFSASTLVCCLVRAIHLSFFLIFIHNFPSSYSLSTYISIFPIILNFFSLLFLLIPLL